MHRGQRELLEPRVMMVLVALARDEGRTVSRDMLIERCWGGLIVTDDAINRVIGRLRQLARSSDAFAIETVTRVGYRLTASAAIAAPDPVPALPLSPDASHAPPSRRGILVAAATALAGAAALALWRRSPPAVSTSDSGVDPAVAALLRHGSDAIAEFELGRQQQGLAMLREASVRAPESALASGTLALGLAQFIVRVPMPAQPEWRRQIAAASARALARDPNQPEALAALALATPMFGNWAARDAADRRAVAARGSDSAGLRLPFLAATGQLDAIITLTDAMLARDAAAIPARYHRVHALWGLGRTDEADRASATSLRLFPGNFYAWFQRLYLLMYSARPNEAEAMTADRAGWPRGVADDDVLLGRRMARALAAPDSPAATAVLGEFATLARTGRGYIENGARLAAALGRDDVAFDYLEKLYGAPLTALPAASFPRSGTYGDFRDRRTDLLYYPPVSRLLGAPRGRALLDRTGLAAFSNGIGVAATGPATLALP